MNNDVRVYLCSGVEWAGHVGGKCGKALKKLSDRKS